MRRFGFLGVAVAVVGLAGCSANGNFYPVQGPLAQQTPPPVFTGRFTAHPPVSLTASVSLAQGEKATGTLYRTFPAPKDALPAGIPAEMRDQWDQVYGQGSYVAHVLGQGQDARGVLTGTDGTTLTVEVHTGQAANGAGGHASPLKGVAQDNKGNLYKVTF